MATPEALSRTVENYLKCIYVQESRAAGELVPMGQIAKAMKVSPGTATAMMQTLAESKLAQYEPRRGVRLTDSGKRLALKVLRRHRLVESFLVEVLGLDWSTVHAEAEELEHVISERILERFDRMLGHPQVDPHGDPIPDAEGRIQTRRSSQYNLTDCQLGSSVRVVRVMDQVPEFLDFLHSHGLTPGVELTVQRREAAADSVTLLPSGGTPMTIGSAAAKKILVEPIGEAAEVAPIGGDTAGRLDG
jgi:DtxR family Mn-dependent transcriptional regulator